MPVKKLTKSQLSAVLTGAAPFRGGGIRTALAPVNQAADEVLMRLAEQQRKNRERLPYFSFFSFACHCVHYHFMQDAVTGVGRVSIQCASSRSHLPISN